MPFNIRANLYGSIGKRAFLNKYKYLPRETAMEKLMAQLDFKEVFFHQKEIQSLVQDMEDQYAEMRKARAHLFYHDTSAPGVALSKDWVGLEERIDWNVNEPEIGPFGWS
jgi:hypothetical protein